MPQDPIEFAAISGYRENQIQAYHWQIGISARCPLSLCIIVKLRHILTIILKTRNARNRQFRNLLFNIALTNCRCLLDEIRTDLEL